MTQEDKDLLTTISLCIITSSGCYNDSTSHNNITIDRNDELQYDMSVRDISKLINEYNNSINIQVNGYTSDQSLLIENWSLKLIPINDLEGQHTVTVQYLTQAIKSFIHFSQINSWKVLNGGCLPFHISYKLLLNDELSFVTKYETHIFPIGTSVSTSIKVTVHYLTRINQLPFDITNGSHKPHPLTPHRPHPLIPPTVTTNGIHKPHPPTTVTSRQIQLTKEGTIHPVGVVSTGQVGVVNSSVRPSGSCSPIPSLLQQTSDKKLKRRSYGLITSKDIIKQRPVRSMSLPTTFNNLSLLGTFEESVLNGRIEPCGYVQGFSAELGASGTFCPEHIILPVTASFFNISEYGNPSPYLGHLDLTIINKRGYRIPLVGTIQLTLFNPNKTVVKIFILKYDHSDMPSCTSTFIRQKTVSHQINKVPVLHYLIHLRFICSKYNRLYLHTDIKLIFALTVPDNECTVITEGPTDPKYCLINDV